MNLKKLSSLFLLTGMIMPANLFAQNDAELQTATFEELPLEKESFWNGSDETGSFTSGSFKFMNSYNPEWGAWEGFSYANLTSNVFESYSDSTHFTNAVGGGYEGSANYVLTNASGFMGITKMEVINPSADGNLLRGFYITNAACTMKAISEGMAPARAFAKGDWLMLTITEPSTGKKMEYYLADYRSENEADHYALNTWQWVDLRELGNVKTLEFKVTGSDSGIYGLNTPSYFCMDNFNGQREITEVAAQTIKEGETINLANFFTFDDNGATITYTVDEPVSGENGKFEIKDGQLIVSSVSDSEFKILVKAVQKGKIQYVMIPVTFTTSVEGVEVSGDIESEYTIDGIRANSNVKGIKIVRDVNGKVKKVLAK